MRGRASTLRGKEHQETEDHDHELSARLDRKENGKQFLFLYQVGRGAPAEPGSCLVGRSFRRLGPSFASLLALVRMFF